MKSDRRRFIRGSVSALGAMAFSSFFSKADGRDLKEALRSVSKRDAGRVAYDEDIWHIIQNAYTTSPNILNLNNGGVSPQPKVVQEAFESYNRFSNEGPAYYMWEILGEGRESVRSDLARMAGASAEEIAIVRNTTEALETVIFGLNLKKVMKSF